MRHVVPGLAIIEGAGGIVGERKREGDAAAWRHDGGKANADGAVGGIHGFGEAAEIIVPYAWSGWRSGVARLRKLSETRRGEQGNEREQENRENGTDAHEASEFVVHVAAEA